MPIYKMCMRKELQNIYTNSFFLAKKLFEYLILFLKKTAFAFEFRECRESADDIIAYQKSFCQCGP